MSIGLVTLYNKNGVFQASSFTAHVSHLRIRLLHVYTGVLVTRFANTYIYIELHQLSQTSNNHGNVHLMEDELRQWPLAEKFNDDGVLKVNEKPLQFVVKVSRY